jgi:tetratricopeptide (TPR) repeat protein
MSSVSSDITDHWLSREVAAMAEAYARGEQVEAESIIARHPGLDAEAAVRLIYEETLLRRDAGQDVDTEEVLARHPRWAGELRDLFDCDRLFRPGEPSAAFPEVGETLGPFLLLDELGRGASGRTYLATDPTLADRPVVVKVIPDDQDEHLALARLRHTHIVPLFSEHAFPDRGLRVLCMPDLGGTSLARVLDELNEVAPSRWSGRLVVEIIDRNTRSSPATPPADGPFRRGLEQSSFPQAMTWIAACLADALHYAHARGLVHMDVKPSNVLITVDGQPMLLDFHLARGPIRRGERVVDRLGGTPGWMSPEQEAAMASVVEGRASSSEVDGRSDIYALGLLLKGSLGGSDSGVGLADIVRKCLHDDPRHRYEDAASLAEDLRRELADLPLRGVRNRSPRELWRKWRRRHPGALGWGVAMLAIAAALAVVGATGAIAYRQRIDQARSALRDGRDHLARGQYTEAEAELKRGRDVVAPLPASAALRAEIDREAARAERGRMAGELHEAADVIRFQNGIDPPSASEAKSLKALCRVLWDRRDRVLPRDGDEVASEARVRADLIEVAAAWADLLARQSPPARDEALRIVDEATSSYGPSFLLDDLRRRLDPDSASRPDGASARRPRSAWEHYDLGRSYLRSGRFAEASEEFLRTLDQRPQDFWSSFYEGLCAFRLHRLEDASSAFRVCVALAPRSAICRYNRGLVLDAMGRTDEARDAYSAALEIDPALAPALLNRGILSYNAKHHDEAVADFALALKATSDRQTLGRIHYNLALARFALGDMDSARESAETAARLGSAEARTFLRDLR